MARISKIESLRNSLELSLARSAAAWEAMMATTPNSPGRRQASKAYRLAHKEVVACKYAIRDLAG